MATALPSSSLRRSLLTRLATRTATTPVTAQIPSRSAALLRSSQCRRTFGTGSSSLTTLSPSRAALSGTASGSWCPRSYRQQQFVRVKSDSAEVSFRQWGFEDITASLPTDQPSPTHKPVILIDVREPAELLSTGIIPSAVSVPLASQPDALFLTPDEFETRFGYPKPGVGMGGQKGEGAEEEGGDIIFYCKAGVRARAAAQLAVQAGYEAGRIGVYDGSWLDWMDKGGKVVRWEGEEE